MIIAYIYQECYEMVENYVRTFTCTQCYKKYVIISRIMEKTKYEDTCLITIETLKMLRHSSKSIFRLKEKK